MDGRAWWAAVHGVAKSRTRLSDFTFTFHFRALEKAMATHSSTLAWKIPWTEEPGGLHAVHGVAKSRTRLSDFTFTFHFHALEKEMATHSCVLAWGIPGTGEPGGLPSIGSHKSDTTEATQQQQHTHKQVLTWDVRTTCHFSEHCW